MRVQRYKAEPIQCTLFRYTLSWMNNIIIFFYSEKGHFVMMMMMLMAIVFINWKYISGESIEFIVQSNFSRKKSKNNRQNCRNENNQTKLYNEIKLSSLNAGIILVGISRQFIFQNCRIFSRQCVCIFHVNFLLPLCSSELQHLFI